MCTAAYGGIALPNRASIALHERFGFTLVGTYTEQGRKFGRYWDVAWYEKALTCSVASGHLPALYGRQSTQRTSDALQDAGRTE